MLPSVGLLLALVIIVTTIIMLLKKKKSSSNMKNSCKGMHLPLVNNHFVLEYYSQLQREFTLYSFINEQIFRSMMELNYQTIEILKTIPTLLSHRLARKCQAKILPLSKYHEIHIMELIQRMKQLTQKLLNQLRLSIIFIT